MKPIVREIGKIDYVACWEQMREITEKRNASSNDEIWLVEHNPVFTLGLAGKEEHVLVKDHNIPMVRTDRGGQVTYHGPGQIVVYLLIDLGRIGLSTRDFVVALEEGIIKFLAKFKIEAYGDRDAPGVYVNKAKIASIGLKIRKGCTYHGISLNLTMDKTPFTYINPCGYAGLQVVNMDELCDLKISFSDASKILVECLIKEIYKS